MPGADAGAWKAFTDLAEVQRRRVLVIARDLDLSPPQMWALRYLVPPAPDGRAGDGAGLRDVQPHGHRHRLEKRGLVERQASPTDRRVRTLALTPAGVKLRRPIIRRLGDPADGFGDALSAAEREQLSVLLRRVAEAVVDADGLRLPDARKR